MRSCGERESEARHGRARHERSPGADRGGGQASSGKAGLAPRWTSRLAVRNLQRRIRVDRRSLQTFLDRVSAEVGPAGASTTVVLVGDDRIRVLNRVFLGYDRPTDVLAFPTGQPAFPWDGRYLGDIIISVDTARRQAVRRRSRLARELRVLTLHGFLHLLGYDHATDGGKMRRLEYRLRRKLGLALPRRWQR